MAWPLFALGQAPSTDSTAGDAVGDRHAHQSNATSEGLTPNASDAIGDRHTRQHAAVLEGIFPNSGDRSYFEFLCSYTKYWLFSATVKTP